MDAVVNWFDAHLISILNGLAIGVLLFVMAVGLSLIFGLMDVLNLAHGAIFFLGSYIAFQTARGGQGFLVAMAIAALVGLGLGIVLTVAVRPIAGRGHLDQVLLTLGFAFVLSDSAAAIWGTDVRSVRAPAVLGGSVEVLGKVYPRYRLGVIVIGLVIAALVYWGFERTRLGAIIRAAVQDRAMVSALGINANYVLMSVLALGAGLAALSGVIGAPVLSVGPGLDWEVLILALIVVVVGGLGSVRGAFVGALLIGQARTLGVALLPQLAPFVLFGAMAVVLLLRPQGLFGSVRS